MIENQMKNLAWNTFKQTGNIDTFLEFMQVQNIEKNKQENAQKNIKDIQYGNYQSKGNHSFGK